MDPLTIFLLFALAVIILSGLISGSEAALLSVSYPEVKEIVSSSKTGSRKKKAENLLKIKDNIQDYITTIVVLNNVVNIIGSIITGIMAAQIFGSLGVGIASGVLTFLIILFSEIIPKLYGEKHSKKISMKIANPLIFLTKIISPLVWVLNKLVGIFIDTSKTSAQVSEGVIREMAIMGKQEGSINQYESNLIENVFELDDMPVYDIMVPKSKVMYVRKNSTFEEIVELAEKTGFTRFPVFDKDDEIAGVINVKDLFKFYKKADTFKVSKILRPVIFAPETMKVSTIEQKIKKNRIHMAIVVNEHGEFSGVVTLEDVIEELLGDIEDEFDFKVADEIKELKPNTYRIEASVEINTLNNILGLDVNSTEHYSTLNGFLIAQCEEIPKTNDIVEIEEGIFTVKKRTKKRILTVEFKRKDEE